MATDSIKTAGNPVIIGDKIITPTKDGKVQIQSVNGGDAVSMEMEEFKQYLMKNAQKTQSNAGDTVAFKGNGPNDEDCDEPKEKKGLHTGTKLILAAGLIGLAIWKRNKISEYYKKFMDIFKKAEPGVKEAAATTKAGKPTITPESVKAYDDKINAQIKKGEEVFDNPNNTEHATKEKELKHLFGSSTKVTSGKLHNGTEYLLEKDNYGRAITFMTKDGRTITNTALIEAYMTKTRGGKMSIAANNTKTIVEKALKPPKTTNLSGVNNYVDDFERNHESYTNQNGPEHIARQNELNKLMKSTKR